MKVKFQIDAGNNQPSILIEPESVVEEIALRSFSGTCDPHTDINFDLVGWREKPFDMGEALDTANRLIQATAE